MCEIKLIGFDLDGTVVEEGPLIPEDCQDILTGIAQKGVKLATASGRPLDQQYDLLKVSGLSPSTGWPHALIANESQIYLLRGEQYEPLESWNSRIRHEWMRSLPRARQIILEELARLKSAGVKVERHITDEQAESRNLIDLLFESVEDARAFSRTLSARLSKEGADLWSNRNYCLVQILHPLAGKGNTLAELMRYLGLNPGQVLVIGDSCNDLDMLDGRHGFRAATGFAPPRSQMQTRR